MDYHYNDEQDTDWSNSEEVAQFEEEQNVNEVRQDEHEVSGKSEEPWHQVQRVGSRYRCPTCGYTRNTKNQMDRHMEEHKEDIDECIHVINTCDKCADQNKKQEQLESHKKNAHESGQIVCNKCNLVCKGKNELSSHIQDKHKSFKPCIKFGAGKCDTENCRFYHIKLIGNQEICYKCKHISLSKTENITHIKAKHGHEICFKFQQNECSRSSEECIFTHESAQNASAEQQVFWESPTPQPPSPGLRGGMPTMSEHLQNQQKVQSTQVTKALPVNFVEMIPQIVSQVLIAFTQMHIKV